MQSSFTWNIPVKIVILMIIYLFREFDCLQFLGYIFVIIVCYCLACRLWQLKCLVNYCCHLSCWRHLLMSIK